MSHRGLGMIQLAEPLRARHHEPRGGPHFELGHRGGAPRAAAFPLEGEHRRCLSVLGTVLDVIDADDSPGPARATKVPSGCSMTMIVHPLSWGRSVPCLWRTWARFFLVALDGVEHGSEITRDFSHRQCLHSARLSDLTRGTSPGSPVIRAPGKNIGPRDVTSDTALHAFSHLLQSRSLRWGL
jgi:hypothetical protein